MTTKFEEVVLMNVFTGPENVGKKVVVAGTVGAVTSGIATKYWLELISYPAGSARSLWLLVNNVWYRTDNPSVGIQQSVQDAFVNRDKFEVAVWYATGNEVIQGLVVRTK